MRPKIAMCLTRNILHLEHMIVKFVEYIVYAFAFQLFTASLLVHSMLIFK